MATKNIRVYAAESAEVKESSPNSNFGHVTVTSGEQSYALLLVKFGAIQGDALYCKLVGVSIGVYVQSMTVPLSHVALRVSSLKAEFDANLVTYNTSPYTGPFGYTEARPSAIPGYIITELNLNSYPSLSPVRHVLQYGSAISCGDLAIQTAMGLNKPYLDISYDDSQIAGLRFFRQTPAPGTYIDKNAENIFSWETKNTFETLGTLYQQNAVLEWRTGTTGESHKIQCGTDTSVTLFPGTLIGENIQYRVTVTANSGIRTTSDWIPLITTEPAPTSRIISPNNAVLDGSIDNVFSWSHTISTGTAQTAFDLQTSPDEVTWTTLRSMATSDTFTVIPADTLNGGDLYWRVRTYNTDGVAGEWSSVAHCIVLAAPSTPLVSVVDNSPRFAIRWQQLGQEAFEIRLDGEVVAKTFGTESSYRHNNYLADGNHQIEVRVQNKYGLWSAWDALSLTISNVAGSQIMLNATAGTPANLYWATVGSYDAYLVYRNGLLIVKTTENSYQDHFALGLSTYQVRGVYADTGYYTMSNSVELDIAVDALMIASVKDPKWLHLRLSATQIRTRSQSAARSVGYLHLSGRSLPSAEIGEAVDRTYQFDVAFKLRDKESCDALEALLGTLVCVKDPYGMRVVGVFGSYTMTSNLFYRSYSCQITPTDWEEEVRP